MTENKATSVFERPHLLVSRAGTPPTRSVADLLCAIENLEVPRRMWELILADATAAIDADPLTVFTPLPDRTPGDIAQGNAEYIIVDAAGQRVLKCALAGLLTGASKFSQAALAQIDCLFERDAWPEWQDLYHRRSLGFDADLRTGQFCRDLGVAYDWLHSQIGTQDRQRMLDGIDRCGIQPFLRSVAQNPPWMQQLSNWTTCIVGGLGICGMGLDTDHADSAQLITLAETIMERYLRLFGAEGEFNENPSYANASMAPVLFYSALRCHRADPRPFPALDLLRRHCYWCLYASAPPGHMVSFGDGGPDYPALTSFFPAVAAALRDPILQWYYLEYGKSPRFPIWELLWFDGSLESKAPSPEDLPLGKAYPEHSALASSRTSWDLDSTACVVFGKGGHGGNIHSHPDAGQIEIHGHGKRLIVDLGTVHYPPGDDRRPYYHFGAQGHNIVTIGGRNPYWEKSGERRSHLSACEFDNERGGWWRIDLTELHDRVQKVTRTTIHLLPGYVVVLDRVELQAEEEIKLRWHTVERPELSLDGSFIVTKEDVILSARIVTGVGPEPRFSIGSHEYQAPLDRDRIGNPLPQRREPYLDSVVVAQDVSFLSLFAVEPESTRPTIWVGDIEGSEQRWIHEDGVHRIVVRLADDVLIVVGDAGLWEVPI